MIRSTTLVFSVSLIIMSVGLVEAVPLSMSSPQGAGWKRLQSQEPRITVEVQFQGRAVGWLDAALERKQLLFPSGVVIGELIEVQDAYLKLEVGAAGGRSSASREVRIDRHDIHAIYRLTETARDSLWNGLLFGTGIGAGSFAIGFLPDIADVEGNEARNAFAIAFIGGGAGLGLLVDYLHKGVSKALIYQAPADFGF